MTKKINPINSDLKPQDVPKKLVDGLMNTDLPDDIRAEIQGWFKSEVSENQKYDALEEIFNKLEEDTQQHNDYIERCLAEQHKKLGFPSITKQQIHQTPKNKTTTYFGILFRVAAVLLPLFIQYGTYLYINENQSGSSISETTINTVIGEEETVKDIILPDNTIISLTGGALVRYKDDFIHSREVYIEGEAFFSVTHNPDQPFIVRSNSITVTVHGTEFHMKAYPDRPTAEVKLTAGSVVVTAEGIEETTMVPGQHFIYDRSHRTITLEVIGQEEILRLLKQNLLFKGHSLDDAFRMMARYFSTQFRVDPRIDLTERIAVSFEDDINLEEALSLIQKIAKTRFDFIVEVDSVILKKAEKY